MIERNQNGRLLPMGSLDPASPSAQWWFTIVGTFDVPLKSPVAELVSPELDDAPDDGEPQRCYFIDLDRLTPQQIDNICVVMAVKFNVPVDEVRAGIRAEHGLPVMADHISNVIFDGRMLL